MDRASLHSTGIIWVGVPIRPTSMPSIPLCVTEKKLPSRRAVLPVWPPPPSPGAKPFGAGVVGAAAAKASKGISGALNGVKNWWKGAPKTVPTNNPFINQNIGQLEKSRNSIQKLIKEHEQKLLDYIKNPDAHDNLGKLKNVPEKIRNQIIEGRKRELERQILRQKNDLKQIDDLLQTSSPSTIKPK